MVYGIFWFIEYSAMKLFPSIMYLIMLKLNCAEFRILFMILLSFDNTSLSNNIYYIYIRAWVLVNVRNAIPIKYFDVHRLPVKKYGSYNITEMQYKIILFLNTF